MEALNMLNSKNENKVSPKKGPQLLEPEPQEIGNFFQDSKMIKDAPAEAAGSPTKHFHPEAFFLASEKGSHLGRLQKRCSDEVWPDKRSNGSLSAV